MLQKIHQLATGRNVLILLALDLIMMFGVMPVIGSKLAAYSNSKKAGPIDLEIPTYSTDRAYELLTDYGAAGRQFYKTIEMTVDVIYPLIYGFAFALLIAFLWSRIAPGTRVVRYFPLLPLFSVLFDYLENIGIVTLINNFPKRLDTVAEVASVFSLIKWSLAFLSIALIVIGLVSWGTKLVAKSR